MAIPMEKYGRSLLLVLYPLISQLVNANDKKGLEEFTKYNL